MVYGDAKGLIRGAAPRNRFEPRASASRTVIIVAGIARICTQKARSEGCASRSTNQIATAHPLLLKFFPRYRVLFVHCRSPSRRSQHTPKLCADRRMMARGSENASRKTMGENTENGSLNNPGSLCSLVPRQVK